MSSILQTPSRAWTTPTKRFHYLGAQMDTKSVDDPQRESLAIVVVA